MKLTSDQLRKVYDRTSGYCHICHKKVYFKNRGQLERRGAWEVDHSIPRAKGGSDHLNNLFPACIRCNRIKQDKSNYSQRNINGVTRAPISARTRASVKRRNILAGAGAGAAIGARFGIPGIICGSLLGAVIGDELKIKK